MCLKKEFLANIIDYILEKKSLLEIRNNFFSLINSLKFSLKEIQKAGERKKNKGNFKKRIILKEVLILENEEFLIKKYLFSKNNIYLGKVKINKFIYHKIITEKAIRDDVENLIFLTKDYNFINGEKQIGIINFLEKEEFFFFLKNKLLEETKEFLASYSLKNKLEELFDIYSVIEELFCYI